MQFGEFSSEDWLQVLPSSDSLSLRDLPQANFNRNRNSNAIENSDKPQASKELSGLTLDSRDHHASKSSSQAVSSVDSNRVNGGCAALKALQRLWTILADAESESQLKESNLLQAAELQGVDRESCTYYVPRGIINRGNTCFISAVLQALLAVNSFRLLFLYLLNTIRQATKESIISWQDFSRKFPLLHKLCRVVEQFAIEGSDSIVSGEKSTSKTTAPTRWYERRESIQAIVSQISKNPISIEDWFQWNTNTALTVRPPAADNTRQSTLRNEHGNHSSPRLNSFLALLFGGNQEDSQEFLIHMLNELHEELRLLRQYLAEQLSFPSEVPTGVYWEYPEVDHRENNLEDGPWEEVGKKGKTAIIRPFQFQSSWISFIFGGILRSELHRIGSKSSVSREPFFFLELDIQSSYIHSLYDALRQYMEPEKLDGVISETTKQKVQARKQVTIERLPRVLVLQLKRFTMRNGDQFYRKLGKRIEFPIDLCLPSMLLTHSYSYTKPLNRSYSLVAVVTHLGRELLGGHYICDIRWRVPERKGSTGDTVWLNCDDSTVTCISEKVVLSRQAYLLFYIKNDDS